MGQLGALAQLGERRLCKPEVAGSIPARSMAQQSQIGEVVTARSTLRGYEMATPAPEA